MARELDAPGEGDTLYIRGEPATGLPFEDVRKLLEILRALVEKGNTVIAIEHHLDVMRAADWVVDLGPGAGDAGGRVVAVGPAESIAECAESHTGLCLKAELTATSPAVNP